MAEDDVNSRLDRLISGDRFASLLGIRVEEASEDVSRVSAIVQEQFLNMHNLGHGGFVFALADVAFSLTVNARSDAVAVQWSLNQFRPAGPGERLVAECRLLHGGRRLRVVELIVSNGDGKVLAKGQATAVPVEQVRGRA